MKIGKIVVNELPEGCRSCQLHSVRPVQRGLITTCFVLDRNVINDSTRPSFCPLEVEETCEWEYLYWEQESQYNYKAECKEYPSMMYKNQHTFCPECGKRISYRKEED